MGEDLGEAKRKHIRPSNKNPVPGIGFPKLFRDAHFFALENTVKVRNVIETAFIGYFGHGVGRVDQHT